MKSEVKEIHPVDDDKAADEKADDAIETNLMVTDSICWRGFSLLSFEVGRGMGFKEASGSKARVN